MLSYKTRSFKFIILSDHKFYYNDFCSKFIIRPILYDAQTFICEDIGLLVTSVNTQLRAVAAPGLRGGRGGHAPSKNVLPPVFPNFEWNQKKKKKKMGIFLYKVVKNDAFLRVLHAPPEVVKTDRFF